MALDFPSSPTNGQTYTSSGRTWTWNSTSSTWESTNTLSSTQVTTALGFTPVQQGGGTNQGTNKVYIGWLGSQLGLTVDVTNFGGTWPINITGSASAFKRSVNAATTANITLSGTQTIDGIALVAEDRVLVKDQTTASENGIYVVSATAWSRSADADSISRLAGALVNVDSGTVNGGKLFETDLKTTDTLGTTAVTWSQIVDNSSVQTLTNKRINPRVSSTASITSPLAWNSDSFDQYVATAQATALTINADAGTPVDGQKAIFRLEDNGTIRVLTFTGGVSKGFRPVGVTMTASASNWTYTTAAGKITYFGCIYNSTDARWDIIAISQEA